MEKAKVVDLGHGLLAVQIEDAKFAVVSDIEYHQPAQKATKLATFVCSGKAGNMTIKMHGTSAAKAKGLI